MKNKGCFLAFALGIVAGIIAAAGGLVGGTLLFKDKLIEMKEGTLQPPPLVAGVKADYAWEVVTSAGEKKSLETLKGKIAIVHLFSPDCPNCLAEWPTLVNLYKKTEDLEIPIICIAMKNTEDLAEFTAQYNPPFPLYAKTDPVPELFAAHSIPVTFIYGKDGNILFKHVGSAKWDDDSVVEYLKRLME